MSSTVIAVSITSLGLQKESYFVLKLNVQPMNFVDDEESRPRIDC